MGGIGMMVTVDTHVIIWNALKPNLLSRKAKESIDIANETDGIIFCEISLWEIAMLLQKKRLEIDVSFIEFINLIKATNNHLFKGISPAIAELATSLPPDINQDPADRIICATAINYNAELITADKNLRKSTAVRTVW
jgi:PIN domain nuclease of toxin-antitoxin system